MVWQGCVSGASAPLGRAAGCFFNRCGLAVAPMFFWGFGRAGLMPPQTRLVWVVGREADIVELMPRIQHIVHNRCMDTKPPTRHPITCEFDGETHKATYWVAGKILTVATRRGGNSKKVGTMEPEVLARQLLLELVKAGKA